MTVNELWDSNKEQDWRQAMVEYDRLVKPADLALDRELERLDLNELRQLDALGWYNFLHDRYFHWKYTAANRLATTRKSLSKYVKNATLDELLMIKEQLLAPLFPKNDAGKGLKIAKSIHGLGVAGASGLLALLYPTYYGTVDQFVVKALRNVGGLPQRAEIERMNPDGLTCSDGVTLIKIMRDKAAENNSRFKTDSWSPRKIDKALWACRDQPQKKIKMQAMSIDKGLYDGGSLAEAMLRG